MVSIAVFYCFLWPVLHNLSLSRYCVSFFFLTTKSSIFKHLKHWFMFSSKFVRIIWIAFWSLCYWCKWSLSLLVGFYWLSFHRSYFFFLTIIHCLVATGWMLGMEYSFLLFSLQILGILWQASCVWLILLLRGLFLIFCRKNLGWSLCEGSFGSMTGI